MKSNINAPKVPAIPHSALLNAYDYNKETGVFIRRMQMGHFKPGSVAGWQMVSGYVSVRFYGSQFLAHRLAWFYVYGAWPVNVIDHINGVRHDNRIANLRDVTQKINSRNIVAPSKNNRAGFLGVHFRAGLQKPWRSGFSYDGRYKHLGYFETAEDAHHAYLHARQVAESHDRTEPPIKALPIL